jgi:hypothetical protein
MEMFVTLKITHHHVIDAVQEAVGKDMPDSLKGLSRKEKRKVRDAGRQASRTIALLEDARDSIDAQKWAKRQAGESIAVHDRVAQGIRVPYPLSVPFLIVDTGERKRPPKVCFEKVPCPVPILDEGTDYLEAEAFYADTLKQWEYAAKRAAREDDDDLFAYRER